MCDTRSKQFCQLLPATGLEKNPNLHLEHALKSPKKMEIILQAFQFLKLGDMLPTLIESHNDIVLSLFFHNKLLIKKIPPT